MQKGQCVFVVVFNASQKQQKKVIALLCINM